ncbi:MAG: family 10 glycosylhydrolase [Bacilli bacterium]
MKRIPILIFTLFLGTLLFSLDIHAEISLEPLENAEGSGYVTYRNQTTEVMIPTEYTAQKTEFRAVWVSPLVGDVGLYTNDGVFKSELLGVLDVMESFHLNAIVFHVRIMHDALYASKLNIKSNYIAGANFEQWDYLEWFISECHRRGIEFHAWLNPYRITNSQTSLEFITSKYAKYSFNPASKADNVIIGNSGAILNPGEPAVRKFVIDTCMELIENYNIDAIHFDDYFYASMPANSDYSTYLKYKSNSQTTNINDWRREQIDLFIEQLSTTMRSYNQDNNRQVQLGIAPTGIWQNGNGVVTYDANGTAVTNGSNTAGQEHYSNYLYCNTKKWVDNEWIDYIIPQSYWSFELKAAPYADVVDWWAKVVRYKKVNLYTGMGFYRHFSGDSGASWETNLYEASNQVLYNTKHPEIKGVCIFNYKYVKSALLNPGMAKVLNEYWVNPVPTPAIETMTPLIPQAVESLKIHQVDNNRLILWWKPSTDATKYLIYRSEGAINLEDTTQLVGIVGANKNGDCLFSQSIDYEANFAVVAVSGTGHQSMVQTIHTSEATTDMPFEVGILNVPTYNSVVYPKASMQINFASADIFIGSVMDYQVYESDDQEEWTLLTGRLRSFGITYGYTFDYPNTLHPMYVKIVGMNEFGTLTSPVLKIEIRIYQPSDLLSLSKRLLDNQLASIFGHDE